jgi:CheY-like chemotaxis protein
MDMQLPVMDGCEAMRQIEADELPANTDHRREFIRNDAVMRKKRTPAVTTTSRNPTLPRNFCVIRGVLGDTG